MKVAYDQYTLKKAQMQMQWLAKVKYKEGNR